VAKVLERRGKGLGREPGCGSGAVQRGGPGCRGAAGGEKQRRGDRALEGRRKERRRHVGLSWQRGKRKRGVTRSWAGCWAVRGGEREKPEGKREEEGSGLPSFILSPSLFFFYTLTIQTIPFEFK
jgi:hypothetical protein